MEHSSDGDHTMGHFCKCWIIKCSRCSCFVSFSKTFASINCMSGTVLKSLIKESKDSLDFMTLKESVRTERSFDLGIILPKRIIAQRIFIKVVSGLSQDL